MQLETTQDIIGTFVLCDGLAPLALEVLNKQHHSSCPEKAQCTTHKVYTETDLIEAVAQNLSRVQDLTRAKALISTYKTTMMFLDGLPGRQQNMDGFEYSKTVTNLLARLEELTNRKSDTNINIGQLIYEQLTPQQREAWLYIEQEAVPQPAQPNKMPTLQDIQATIIDGTYKELENGTLSESQEVENGTLSEEQ